MYDILSGVFSILRENSKFSTDYTKVNVKTEKMKEVISENKTKTKYIKIIKIKYKNAVKHHSLSV